MTALRRGVHETLLNGAAGINRQKQHGLLLKHKSDLRSQPLCTAKETRTAAADRAHDHLSHVTVLGFALPKTACLEEGRALEPGPDQVFQRVAEDVRIDPAGNANIEAGDAGGLGGHSSSISGRLKTSKKVQREEAPL